MAARNGNLNCIDMSDRFILGGNTSIYIYDLAERDKNSVHHHVIQQSANAGHAGSGVCTLQWYRPDDTGVFVSGSCNGEAHVWDTAQMVAVLTLKPYYPEKTLRCLRLNQQREALAAAGSYDDPTIKLLDLKSGTSSHTLTPSTTGGVSDLQWSPSYEYILASCSRDSILRLWDIRRPNQVLTTCSSDSRASDVLPAVSLPTAGERMARHQRPSRHQSNEAMTAGTHLQFAGNHWLVALDGNKGDIHVWDLRFPQPVQQPGRYVNPTTNGKPLCRNVRRQPCVVGSRGKSIWVAGSSSTRSQKHWVEYPLDETMNGDGKPLQTLCGHLGEILCAAATPMHMVTAGADALALVWERSRRRPKAPTATIDKDTW